jgi:hypothetical protein
VTIANNKGFRHLKIDRLKAYALGKIKPQTSGLFDVNLYHLNLLMKRLWCSG